MPTFRQLLGADREFVDVPWIAREQAIQMLADAHEYLKACQELQGREVADALVLLHGAILELQISEGNGLWRP